MQLATQTPYTLHAEPLLAGDAGTHQTIQRIRRLVDAGKRDPFVNHTTGEILRAQRVAAYNDGAEVRAIYDWVTRNIRFTKDPDGKETLRPASTILQWGFGDCDDINAVLLPSMLGTVGYRTRLVTIASNPSAPRSFSHVYLEVQLDGRWIPLDAARKGAEFGVEPARQYRKRVWSLTEDAHQEIGGMSGMGSHARLAGCPAPALGDCRSCAAASSCRKYSMMGSHARLGRMYPSSLGFDWGSFADVVQKVGMQTTNIIAAAKLPTGAVYPSAAAYPQPGPSVSANVETAGISQQTLMLLGIGLVGLVVLMGRRS